MSDYGRLISLYKSGVWQEQTGIRRKSKRQISEGKQRQQSAITQSMHLASALGRKAKREKYLRKTTRIVVLTEVFGIPWKVLVRK